MFANPLVELVPFWNRFYFTISELSSQNRDFNSYLCEIFTNLAVKVRKIRNSKLFDEIAISTDFGCKSAVVTADL